MSGRWRRPGVPFLRERIRLTVGYSSLDLRSVLHWWRPFLVGGLSVVFRTTGGNEVAWRVNGNGKEVKAEPLGSPTFRSREKRQN